MIRVKIGREMIVIEKVSRPNGFGDFEKTDIRYNVFGLSTESRTVYSDKI